MFELGFGIFWSLMTLIMTIAYVRTAEGIQFSLIILYGDINIKEVVDYNLIPLNISSNFNHLISENPNVPGADIITVNEVKYKRIDE